MSGRVLHEDPRERRRLLVRSGLRISGVALGMLALYAVLPIPGTSGATALLGLIAGLLLFLVLVGWQLHTIVRDDHPVLRAVEAIAFALPLLIVVFAFTYLTISRADPQSFSEPLGRVDAMYFTVSTLSTVGLGDIAPTSSGARAVVTLQMLFDLALLAGLARLLILATRTGLRRKEGERGGPGALGGDGVQG
jgi:voltage-gated potassium channel